MTARHLQVVILTATILLLSGCGAGNFLEWPKTATVPTSDWAERREYERLYVAHPTIEDMQISYIRVGDPMGQRVIFIHGSPGQSSDWIRYLDEIPEGYEFIAVDRPGFGFTTPVRSYESLKDQGAAIAPFLDASNGDPVILVGWSYGGPVAVQVAADYPSKLKGMILLSTGLDPALEKVRFVQRLGNIWPFTRFVEDGWRIANEELIPLKKELKALAPKLGAIKTRTVIIHGEADDLVPFENVAYAKAALTGVSELHIESFPGLGHSIPFSKFDRVQTAIQRLNDGGAFAIREKLDAATLLTGLKDGSVSPLDDRLGTLWFKDAGAKSELAELRVWAEGQRTRILGATGQATININNIGNHQQCIDHGQGYLLAHHFDFLAAISDETKYVEPFGFITGMHRNVMGALKHGTIKATRKASNIQIMRRSFMGEKVQEFEEIIRKNKIDKNIGSDHGLTLMLAVGIPEFCKIQQDNTNWLKNELAESDWESFAKDSDETVMMLSLTINSDDTALMKNTIAALEARQDLSDEVSSQLERLRERLTVMEKLQM